MNFREYFERIGVKPEPWQIRSIGSWEQNTQLQAMRRMKRELEENFMGTEKKATKTQWQITTGLRLPSGFCSDWCDSLEEAVRRVLRHASRSSAFEDLKVETREVPKKYVVALTPAWEAGSCFLGRYPRDGIIAAFRTGAAEFASIGAAVEAIRTAMNKQAEWNISNYSFRVVEA